MPIDPAIFTVRGRIAFPDLGPAPGVFVAVVDADPDLDDLIGVGTTGPDGTFRLSFTPEAFNQEQGEAEERPDIYVVVSMVQSGTALVPVLRKDFRGLFLDAAREEDLGTLVLPVKRNQLVFPSGSLRAAPGRGKIVKRLRLDEHVIDAAAREVAPIVERLTGFSGLLDGLVVEMVDSQMEVLKSRFARVLGRSDFDANELAMLAFIARECEASHFAQWERDGVQSLVPLRPARHPRRVDGGAHGVGRARQARCAARADLSYALYEPRPSAACGSGASSVA